MKMTPKSKTSVPAAAKIMKGGKVCDDAVMKKSGEQKTKSKAIEKDATKPKYPTAKGCK